MCDICVNWAGIPESLSLYVMSEKRAGVLFYIVKPTGPVSRGSSFSMEVTFLKTMFSSYG